MGAQEEIHIVLNLKDDVSGTFNLIKKEQEALKNGVEETKKSLNDLFKNQFKIMVDNSDFLSSINKAKQKIEEVREIEKGLKEVIRESNKEASNGKKLEAFDIKTQEREIKAVYKKSEVQKVRQDIEFSLMSLKAGILIPKEKIVNDLKESFNIQKIGVLMLRDEIIEQLKSSFNAKKIGLLMLREDMLKILNNVKIGLQLSLPGQLVSKMKNKLEQQLPKLKMKTYEIVAKIKDSATPILKRIKNSLPSIRYSYYFALALKDMASDKLKKIMVKPKNILINAVAKTAIAFEGISKVTQAVKKPFRAIVQLKEKKSEKFNKSLGELKSLGSKVFSPIIKIKDGASKTIGNVKAKITSIAKSLLKPFKIPKFNLDSAVDIATSAIKSGAKLEQQQLSMKQLIGKDNKGKSEAEVSEMSLDYTRNLRDSVIGTNFSSEDAFKAGGKAISLSNGDTKSSMELVNLSENMASMNLGKSLNDAMEALSSAKDGNFKKLDEFGIKITDKDFKALAGKGEKDTLSKEETETAYKALISEKLSPQFNGAKDQQANTSIGIMNTIKGKVNSKLQDAGFNILEKLKPVLKSIIPLIDKYSPLIDKIIGKATDGIGILVGKLPTVKKYLMQAFESAKPAVKWISEQGIPKARTVIDQVSKVVGNVYKNLKPIIDWIITTAVPKVIDIIGGVLEKIAGVYEFITTNWSKLKPFIEGIVLAFAAYKTILMASELCTITLTAASAALNLVMNLNPVGLLIAGIGLLIGLGIALYENWDVVKQKAADLWSGIKQVFSNISDWFDKNVIQPILSIVPNWLKNIFSGGANVTVSGDGDGGAKAISGTHAKGLKSVPFDGYIAELHKGEAVIPASMNPYNNNVNSSSTDSDSQFVININGINKSTSEIVNELVPQLKLSLANM